MLSILDLIAKKFSLPIAISCGLGFGFQENADWDCISSFTNEGIVKYVFYESIFIGVSTLFVGFVTCLYLDFSLSNSDEWSAFHLVPKGFIEAGDGVLSAGSEYNLGDPIATMCGASFFLLFVAFGAALATMASVKSPCLVLLFFQFAFFGYFSAYINSKLFAANFDADDN